MTVLGDEAKSVIRSSMAEDDLIDFHFSLGLAIRNAFGLHVPWSKLLASCDVACAMIISELWRRLRASSEA